MNKLRTDPAFTAELDKRLRLGGLMSDPILREPLAYILDHADPAKHTLVVAEIDGRGYDVHCSTCHRVNKG